MVLYQYHMTFMKRLLLIRHAKAVHDTAYEDFERPLKKSGMADALTMAERLKSEGIIPQILITSTSLRTQATADIITEHLSMSKAHQDKNIYEASYHNLISIINRFDDKYDFIGLVGHNPSLIQAVDYFTGESPDFPPGAIALIDFEFDEWKLLSADTGNLKWYSNPKEDQLRQ